MNEYISMNRIFECQKIYMKCVDQIYIASTQNPTVTFDTTRSDRIKELGETDSVRNVNVRNLGGTDMINLVGLMC